MSLFHSSGADSFSLCCNANTASLTKSFFVKEGGKITHKDWKTKQMKGAKRSRGWENAAYTVVNHVWYKQVKSCCFHAALPPTLPTTSCISWFVRLSAKFINWAHYPGNLIWISVIVVFCVYRRQREWSCVGLGVTDSLYTCSSCLSCVSARDASVMFQPSKSHRSSAERNAIYIFHYPLSHLSHSLSFWPHLWALLLTDSTCSLLLFLVTHALK